MVQARHRVRYVYAAGVATGFMVALLRGSGHLLPLDLIADGLAGLVIAAFAAHLWFDGRGKPRAPRNWAGWVLALVSHGFGCAVALLMLYLLVMAGTMYPHVRQRHQVSTAFVSAGPLRKAIDERLVARQSPAGISASIALDDRGTTLSRPVRPDGAFAVKGLVDSSAFGTARSSFEIGFRPVMGGDGKVRWNCGVLTEPLIWRMPGTAVLPAACRERVADLDAICSQVASCP